MLCTETWIRIAGICGEFCGIFCLNEMRGTFEMQIERVVGARLSKSLLIFTNFSIIFPERLSILLITLYRNKHFLGTNDASDDS
jgi:hypothetical protein